MRWQYLSYYTDVLVADDGEILDEVTKINDRYVVNSTGKAYVSQKQAKDATIQTRESTMKIEHGLFTSDIITLTTKDIVDLLEGKVIKGSGKEIHYERSQALTELNKAAEDMGQEL